ncbi:MAG TPA: hypothetical protein EYQ56_04085, partial [Methylophilaceae bacterium]|nr:hypothetical protein [Methylophilaceae bacterium]
QVVDYNSQQDGKVFFGAWVELEDENGKTLKLKIVGPEEIYNTTDYISIDSPMARACIGKSVDDAIVVNAPNEKHYWTIIAISYYASPPLQISSSN